LRVTLERATGGKRNEVYEEREQTSDESEEASDHRTEFKISDQADEAHAQSNEWSEFQFSDESDGVDEAQSEESSMEQVDFQVIDQSDGDEAQDQSREEWSELQFSDGADGVDETQSEQSSMEQVDLQVIDQSDGDEAQDQPSEEWSEFQFSDESGGVDEAQSEQSIKERADFQVSVRADGDEPQYNFVSNVVYDDNSSEVCSRGFDYVSGQCYRKHDVRTPWYKTNNVCDQNDATITTIHTDSWNNYIQSLQGGGTPDFYIFGSISLYFLCLTTFVPFLCETTLFIVIFSSHILFLLFLLCVWIATSFSFSSISTDSTEIRQPPLTTSTPLGPSPALQESPMPTETSAKYALEGSQRVALRKIKYEGLRIRESRKRKRQDDCDKAEHSRTKKRKKWIKLAMNYLDCDMSGLDATLMSKIGERGRLQYLNDQIRIHRDVYRRFTGLKTADFSLSKGKVRFNSLQQAKKLKQAVAALQKWVLKNLDQCVCYNKEFLADGNVRVTLDTPASPVHRIPLIVSRSCAEKLPSPPS